MNKIMVLCFLPYSFIAMDVPARCHNSAIFTELGIIETDELTNAIRSDIGIYIPDNDFIVEYPGTTKYADAVIKKTTAPVMIKKINDLLGYGVFAQESIAADAVVGEYTGTIVEFSQVYGRSLDDTKFVMELGPFGVDKVSDIRYDLYIDAKKRGNFTRFINHSYRPNLTEKLVFANGLWHIMLIAKASVDAGTQLSIDYGSLYWEARKITPIDL